MPRISIGLPVYNGDNFITNALESILGQTYTDFELIISDNASTDRTEALCKSYAARDPRIRYWRNAENLGAARNFNRVFELSSGEYFKWTAHDDVLAPDYLEKCIEASDRDPSVVLVYTPTKVIDERGMVIGSYEPDSRGFDSEKAHKRFHSRVSRIRPPLPFIGRKPEDADPIFGLIRANALRKIPLFGTCVGSDQVLLARLALLGRFARLPEGLFYNRDHSQRFIRAYRGRYLHATWYDPQNAWKILFPDWALFLEFLRTIHQSSLPPYQRVRCYASMASYLFWNWPRLARDILIVAKRLAERTANIRTFVGSSGFGLSRASRCDVESSKPRT
jgi:glycosyltransferase involved in cell wall biosynthesis